MGHDMKTKEDVNRELENMKKEFHTIAKHLKKLKDKQKEPRNEKEIFIEKMNKK